MNYLIVAAHPDDEIMGCGGSVSLISTKNDVYTLILGEGVTSRDISNDEKNKRLYLLKEQSIKANKLIGVKDTLLKNYPDNKFDTVSLLDIVKTIEKQIEKIKPEGIFTHHSGDLNIDHQITHRAVLTAARPIGENIVKKILTFETLSSTEWNFQNQRNIFIPNYYIDITETLDKKVDALKCYKDELRSYPHPRSLEGIKILAQKRGLEVGLKFAEAFCLIRKVKKL